MVFVMLIDQSLANVRHTRVAYAQGIDILIDVWLGAPAGDRAAMELALGDPYRASRHGDEWKRLVEGDVLGALRVAKQNVEKPGMRLLEAEALIAAGGIVAGIERLEELHRVGYPAGSVALARRRHLLGDHAGAERAALAAPMHAQAALVGARAALANHRLTTAFRFLEPFVNGLFPIPDASVAGSAAAVTAAVLARGRRFPELERLARGLVEAPNLPPEMMPNVARTAWTGGLATQAWERFSGDDQWQVAARLELAVLAGNTELASRLFEKAGPLGAVSAPALSLLRGEQRERPAEDTEKIFGAGVTVHIWRTHPFRWQPWVEAARRMPADVSVFDLGTADIPAPEAIPQVVLDDGSLVQMLQPVAGTVDARGSGVWIDSKLCAGAGVGHEWPPAETEAARHGLPEASRADDAAVRVVAADKGLRYAVEGWPTVAIATPGDPFWAGPLPERVWPALRVVRSDARTGWLGAGEKVAAAAASLLSLAD